MLRKKYVTFTLLYISSLPKTNQLRDQAIKSIKTCSGTSVAGLDFASSPPPWSLKKCLPPFTKMVKLCAPINFQLEKCFAPPPPPLKNV